MKMSDENMKLQQTDSIAIDIDDLFKELSEGGVIPYVQEVDDDGNILCERPMTKEELEEFAKQYGLK